MSEIKAYGGYGGYGSYGKAPSAYATFSRSPARFLFIIIRATRRSLELVLPCRQEKWPYLNIISTSNMSMDANALYPTRNAFDIEIEPTNTVANLRKDIHSAKPVVFSHVDANDLTLWRVSLPDDDGESAITLHALDEKEILHPRTQLSKLFPSPPDDNTYIIVQTPTQGN
ncbi:hypothetical protein BGX27_002864 [Mortierella sp. AM989]|nr:hypothetical protein BGX27_002864 [Mortierella sp. AM989]